MKKNTLFLLLFFFGQWMVAQEATRISGNVVVQATVDLASGLLEQSNIRNQGSTSFTNNLRLRLQEGDVVLGFELAPLERSDQYYTVDLSMQLNGKKLAVSNYDDFRGDFNQLETGGQKLITWLNPLEREGVGNVQGTLEVMLSVEKFSPIEPPYPCEEGPPTFFAPSKRLPYYLAAGVGVASIGVGQIFKSKKDDTYQKYLDSETLEEAEPIYQDANRQNEIFRTLTIAGGAILAADAILYFVQLSRFNKKMKDYNTYCKDRTLTVRPLIEMPGSGVASGKAGLQVTLTF